MLDPSVLPAFLLAVFVLAVVPGPDLALIVSHALARGVRTGVWCIDAAKKYVVSSTLDRVDWNAELVRGDVGKAVQQLKRQSGKGLFVGGLKLPLALTELGLIDEYEFVVQPRLAGHGPTLFSGLSKYVDLKLVSRLEFGSGAVAMRYEPRR
jgi:dihydrofolate reductase